MNGQLHAILGMSDDMTVSYVVSLSRQMKDEDKIYQGLLDFDFPKTEQTKGFARELAERSGGGGVNSYRLKELELLGE